MDLAEGYNILKRKAEKIAESVTVSKLLSQKKEAPLPYAYPCDNYIDTILSNGLVRNTLQLFVEKYCKEQILSIKSSGQLVILKNYPQLYRILQSCFKSLTVEDIPEVYVTNKLKGINALSIGTDNTPVILISRKAVISLPEEELKFMIGHELGHILQKNLMCHTIKGLLDNLHSKSEILGTFVSDLIETPLNQWYRCAEYTADRAGLICAGSIAPIRALFERLGNDTIKEYNEIDRYFELSNIHPMYHSRLNELEQFILRQK